MAVRMDSVKLTPTVEKLHLTTYATVLDVLRKKRNPG